MSDYPWPKLDEKFLGGIPYGEIVTIMGGRSAGKSAMAEGIIREMNSHIPDHIVYGRDGSKKDSAFKFEVNTSNYIFKELEEKPMKKTVTFKYMNGKPYTVRDVVEITNPENLWKHTGWVQLLQFTQQPDKYTTINKAIPLNDVVGIIVKEGGKTTIYENPAFNTVVDADVETVRSRIRKGNKKMKQREKASQKNVSWENIKSFAE